MFLYEDTTINTVRSDATVVRPTLDVFLQNSKGKALGAVVVMPGGGYAHLAEHEGGLIAAQFNNMGFHAFVVHYRTAPNRFPAPQQDVLRAIRTIRANAEKWEVATDKIAVLGFSAGGHLCASCGTSADQIPFEKTDDIDNQPSAPNAMILCYPVIDLLPEFGHVGSGDFLFGTTDITEEKRYWCCQNRVTENTPPAFLWHTAVDAAVPVENSIAFAKAMWAAKRTCELHIYPEGHHGIGLGYKFPNANTWVELAGKFLKNNCGFPTC